MDAAYEVAIVGSGPGGLSAAARAAQAGVSHILLEAEAHLSNTIFRYQKGKHVMAEPGVLPLRAELPFEAGKRESILKAWDDGVARLGVSVRTRAEVTAIAGSRGDFTITLADGEVIQARHVVLGIGMQGNLRKVGAPGEDLPFVQYQLDDPEAYANESIAVIGAGDAAIENALALAEHDNKVTVVNRRDEFSRAKDANNAAILAAIDRGLLSCAYNCNVNRIEPLPPDHASGKPGMLHLDGRDGPLEIPVDRIIARLGAIPPRGFVEACGIEFPSKDPSAIPAVSERYESNVPGLFIIGALAGYPLIKQAMNQGYEVIEFIQGRAVEPADEPLLREKFRPVPGQLSVAECLQLIQNQVPVLAPLTTLQLREFLLDSDICRPQPGEIIFRRNDYTNSFFSIVQGHVEISIDKTGAAPPIRLGAGQFFGEMSLISGRRRSATVTAGPDCLLVETPRRSMLKLINSVDAVKRVIDEAFILRAIQSKVAPGVRSEELAELVKQARIEHFKAGQTIFKEGDPGDCLQLIRSGSATISRRLADREVVLAYVPAGNYVGEMALVSDQMRTATVRAAVATETIRLDGEAFKSLLATSPAVREKVEIIYKSRLAANIKAEQSPGVGNMISFLVEQGLGEATDVLLIDESLCVRCDHCEKACADTHGNVSRLDREAGATFANVHVPTSCRHCEHPHCMKDCPPDAIHRAPNGEVYITDSCIGCGNCERNCPYDVIQMGVESPEPPSLWQWLLSGRGPEPGSHMPSTSKDQVKQAVKCDMCKDQSGGPACVRACPTGAAIRVSPEEFLNLVGNRSLARS